MAALPGPDPRATLSWLSMLALEHGRSEAGAWLLGSGAAAATQPRRRRRRRTRSPVAAQDTRAAEPEAQRPVVSAREVPHGDLPSGDALQPPAELEPLVPRLKASEWHPDGDSSVAATLAAVNHVAAAVQRYALQTEHVVTTAALGGSALLLLLLRLTRRPRPRDTGRADTQPGDEPVCSPPSGHGTAALNTHQTQCAPDADNGTDVGDGMLAPVSKGSAVFVRDSGQWCERVLLLRADHSLHMRSLSPGAGAPEAVRLHGAVAASVHGEPLCFTLDTADEAVGSQCLLLRCNTKQETDGWVAALNAASLALGAPLLTSLARPALHHAGSLLGDNSRLLVPASGLEYSSDDGDSSTDGSTMPDEGDALLMSRLRFTPRRDGGGTGSGNVSRQPPPVVRGMLVLSRSALSAVVAPIRVSAALVILPFALTIHGAAAAVGAVKGALTGSSRRGHLAALREQCAEDAEAAPEKQALLHRFLTEDFSSLNGTDAHELD